MSKRIEEKVNKHLNLSNEERIDEGISKFFEKIKDIMTMKALSPIFKAVDNKEVLQKAVETWKDSKRMNAKITDIEGYKEALEKAEEGVKRGQFNNLYELINFMVDAYYKK